MATIDFSNTSFTKPAVDVFYRTAEDRLRRRPGIESTALTTSIPFYSSCGAHLVVPGRSRLPITKDGGPYLVQVTPSYFATAGTPIVRGRGFRSTDGPPAARAAVVSETMANLIWPGQDAIGKCIKISSHSVPCSTVVGVARGTRRQALEAIPVRQTMGSIMPELPFVDVRPLQSLVDPLIQPWRIGAGVFTAFGLLALVIANVGLYGVIADEVVQRTHEFGIRAALGASRRAIVPLVLRRGLGLALAGVALGVAIARAGARWIAPLLFNASATDPSVFVLLSAALFAVALAACFIPAQDASMSDPARALRTE
jgi:putative ABC transport system permease protein